MKLTKQKLEQLIMEEYARSISDEGRPSDPKYSGKLTRLAKDDYPQARSIADALDEPLDFEYDPDNMKTIPAKKYSMEQFEADEMFSYFLSHINREFRLNKKHTDPIDPNHVKVFADEIKQNPEEVLKKLQRGQREFVKITGKFDPYDHMRKAGYNVEDYFGIGKLK